MGRSSRKVCISGPSRPALAEEMLRGAGFEIILGKSVADFPDFRYATEDLIRLIGDADVLLVSDRDVITHEILEACKNLQTVVKTSIGVEKK